MSGLPHPTPGDAPQSLPRVLGRFDAITVVVGSIIGSGIFLKPGVVAEHLGYYGFGAIIAVWIGVGIVTLFGSLALAELAAMLPHAGGPYVYLREAYGRMPAFLWGWTEFWVIRTGSLGALAVATVIYLDKALTLSNESLALGPYTQEALAILVVVGLSAINVIATRWGANVQNGTVVVKVGFLVGLIALPFVMGRVEPAYLTEWTGPAPEGGWPLLFKAVGAAAIAVLWPYDGWINIGPVAEEIHHPQKNVPLALTLGVLIVIVLYCGANLAYHLVLPAHAVATSGSVAADFGNALLGPVGGIIVAIGVMCSTFGAVNSNMLTGPRIYFAMARDGLLPKYVRKVHSRFQTPTNAIVLQAIWTIALVFACFHLGPVLHSAGLDEWLTDHGFTKISLASPGDAFDTLTNFVIFGGLIFYAMAVGAVFVLRHKRPDLDRPYRTWGYPIVPAIYLLFFVAALVSMLVNDTLTSLAGAALILAGVVYYLWARTRPAARIQ